MALIFLSYLKKTETYMIKLYGGFNMVYISLVIILNESTEAK